MGQSSPKKGQLSGNAGHLSPLGSRVASFLRRLYPARTAENVAADTGLKAETIAKMLQRESDPSGSAVMVMGAVYGPDFLAVAFPWAPSWLDAPQRAARADAVLAELDLLRARLEHDRGAS